MRYYLKNTYLVIKRISQILKRDLFKHPIINYFNQNFSKRVLISYITKPFRSGIDLSHTNFVESIEIAKIFNSLKYNVDIINYDYNGFLDYEKFDLIFGFGDPLVNSFTFTYQNHLKRIYYGTGMHISVQNQNSLKRIKDVKIKKGNWILDSGRIVEKAWTPQTTLVDAMIVLGNEEVKKSYQKYFDGNIYSIDPSFYKVCDYNEIIKCKNFDEAKNNYLWFGSSGLIHKGLDLLLDTFKSYPNLHLHICGQIESEQNFKSIYYHELYNLPNIHTYGFVKLNSTLFKELLGKCAFNIYPSCSEGGSPAVINVCGNGGLIPIITKEVTLNVDDFGLLINEFQIDSIKQVINNSQNISVDEIKRLSKISGDNMSKYSLTNFSEQFRGLLEILLEK